MSELDDFMTSAFSEASVIIGQVWFTIAGLFGTFSGTIDRHATSQTLHEEGGGLAVKAQATIVASRAQFQGRPTRNAVLTVDGLKYEIEDIEDDSVAYTLRLRSIVS